MSKTLSLTRRTHLWVRGEKFYIKLQKPNHIDPQCEDYYIVKVLKMKDLIELRDWANDNLKALGIKDTSND